jgi:hypothetical protein
MQLVGKQLHGVAVAQKTRHGKFVLQPLVLIFGRQLVCIRRPPLLNRHNLYTE